MNPSQQLMVSNVSAATPPGQDLITTIGITSWVCPDGVTSVSVVCVSRGYSNLGGSLSYKNNITVVPSTSYSVQNPTHSWAPWPRRSYFIGDSTVSAGIADKRTGDGGGNGANPGAAGGYSGNGGLANWGDYSGGNPGAGGGGGGGAYGDDGVSAAIGASGGVGLLGEGPSGAGGVGGNPGPGGGGGGGSGGVPGQTMNPGVGSANGGNYGGGYGYTVGPTRLVGIGAVRIIWPGDQRYFPSTRTADE